MTKHFLYGFGFLLIFILNGACNNSRFGGNSKSAKQGTASVEAVAGESVQNGTLDISHDTFAELSFDQQLDVSIENFIAMARAIATNDPIDIMGYSFFDISDKLQEYEGELDQLAGKYQSLREFLETADIYSESDIVPDGIESGLASLARALEDGKELPVDASSSIEAADSTKKLGDQASEETSQDRFLMGVTSLPLMRGSSLGLQLLDDAQQAASGAIQANGQGDKQFANPQDGDAPTCVTVIFIGDLDNPACVDAVDRITPCPCV